MWAIMPMQDMSDIKLKMSHLDCCTWDCLSDIYNVSPFKYWYMVSDVTMKMYRKDKFYIGHNVSYNSLKFLDNAV